MTDIFHEGTSLEERSSVPAPLDPLALAMPLSNGEGAEASALNDFCDVLRRWGWLCLFASSVLCAIAVVIVLQLFVRTYTAEALLEIKAQPYFVAFAPISEPGATQAFAETQLEVIKSTAVLARVSAKEEINKLPEATESESTITWLEKNLDVDYAGTSELCKIRFTSRDPKTAANVANAIMIAYLERQSDQRTAHTDAMIKKLEIERQNRHEEVTQLQQRLRMLTTAATGQDPGLVSSGTVVIQPNAVLTVQQTLTEAEVELAVLEAELNAHEKFGEDNAVSDLEVDAALTQHPALQEFDDAVRNRLGKLQEARRLAARGDEEPSVKRLLEQLTKLKSSRDELLEELRPAVESDLKAAAQGKSAGPSNALQARILRQRKLIELWRRQLTEEKTRAAKVGDESLELEFVRSELRRSEEVFQKIADRIVVLRTEQDAPAQAEEMHAATNPVKPDEALPARNLALSLFVALCAPIGLAFLWERLQKRISEARHVTSAGRLLVLGEVATLPAEKTNRRANVNFKVRQERFAFAESVNSLRISLTHTPAFRKIRVLAITSATSGEGKTSLASALASSMARNSGQPTLLVDMDLRSPDVHEVFNVSLEPGLIDVFNKTCSLEDAVVVNPESGLSILAAGRLSCNPHLFFKSQQIGDFLTELKRKYRYIIVDTPPALIASETMIVASACDGALICAMYDQSRQSHINLAYERFSLAGVRLLGCVINGVPIRRWTRRYASAGYAPGEYALTYDSAPNGS